MYMSRPGAGCRILAVGHHQRGTLIVTVHMAPVRTYGTWHAPRPSVHWAMASTTLGVRDGARA